MSFHFCKSIWKKIKKLHLFKKEYRYNTTILAFVMKVYPFIKGNKKEVYYNKIENFCDNLKGNYINLKNYFRRYWKNSEIFNFTGIDNDKIKIRTNNIVEVFHKKINNKVSHYHPKCAYLINVLKKITKNYYDKYINSLSNIEKEKTEFNYLANDITEFVKKFVNNHKENFDIDSLIQYLKIDGEHFYNIIDKL